MRTTGRPYPIFYIMLLLVGGLAIMATPAGAGPPNAEYSSAHVKADSPQSAIRNPQSALALACTQTFNGSITASDSDQAGRLYRNATESTCAAPLTCQVYDSTPRNYDAYTLANNTGSAQCVTITIDGMNCLGNQFLQSVAYLRSFNPNQLCANYLGDIGGAPNPSKSYSVSVPAGTNLVIVVNESTPNAGCPGYRVTVSSDVCLSLTPGPASTVALQTTTPVPPPPGATRTPIPPATGVATASCQDQITACHLTRSGAYREITISCSAIAAHRAHGDTIPAPAGGCPSGEARRQLFRDVPTDHAFFDYVMDLYDMRAISGYTDGTFKPDDSATRAQIAKMVVVANGISPQTNGTQHFRDVPRENPFFGYIEAAHSRDWVGGYTDGTFKLYSNVTRGQIAKLAVLAGGIDLISPDTATFTDVPKDSTFFTYVETAYAHGIVNGYPNNIFAPYDQATRGQLSRIIDLSSHR